MFLGTSVTMAFAIGRVVTNFLSLLDIADAGDKNEISFSKGDILEVTDDSGRWWNVKKVDGTEGSEYWSSLVRALC